MRVEVHDQQLDAALKILKKLMLKDGAFREMKKRTFRPLQRPTRLPPRGSGDLPLEGPRAYGNAPRVATVEAEAFLRRFLLHVPPHRFVRIRHHGWLANSARTKM
jgi:ribosomal protein S21